MFLGSLGFILNSKSINTVKMYIMQVRVDGNEKIQKFHKEKASDTDINLSGNKYTKVKGLVGENNV